MVRAAQIQIGGLDFGIFPWLVIYTDLKTPVQDNKSPKHDLLGLLQKSLGSLHIAVGTSIGFTALYCAGKLPPEALAIEFQYSPA